MVSTKFTTLQPTTGFLCEYLSPTGLLCAHTATLAYVTSENDPYDGLNITNTYRCSKHAILDHDKHQTFILPYRKTSSSLDLPDTCLACGATISPDEPGYYDHVKGRCR